VSSIRRGPSLMGRLPESLSSITYEGQEAFEDAMLRVYKSMLNNIAARATLGMSSAKIRPDYEAIGDNHGWYPPNLVAAAMVKMLRSEGLDAHASQNQFIFVRWPHDPRPWWNSEN